MKAIEVANELKKIVTAFEANPETDVPQGYVFFSAPTKEQFKNVVRMLPHPLKKSIRGKDSSYPKIQVDYESNALDVWISMPQADTCRLVSPAIPAQYECDPILSPEEDAEMEQEVSA